MGGMSEDAAEESRIRLLDPRTMREYATAGAPDVVHASASRGWSSPLVFEVHRMPAHEYDEHVTIDHQLLVNLGDPVSIGWKEDGRRREGVLARGALCIQSDSDANAPRWHGTMTFATAAIPPSMVNALLLDRCPKPASTFAKRHCVSELGSCIRSVAGSRAGVANRAALCGAALASLRPLPSRHPRPSARAKAAGAEGKAQRGAAAWNHRADP